MYKDNYYKSLDHRSFYFKQVDKKGLSAKNFLLEAKTVQVCTSSLRVPPYCHPRRMLPHDVSGATTWLCSAYTGRDVWSYGAWYWRSRDCMELCPRSDALVHRCGTGAKPWYYTASVLTRVVLAQCCRTAALVLMREYGGTRSQG